jgi:hypothetical protein
MSCNDSRSPAVATERLVAQSPSAVAKSAGKDATALRKLEAHRVFAKAMRPVMQAHEMEEENREAAAAACEVCAHSHRHCHLGSCLPKYCSRAIH